MNESDRSELFRAARTIFAHTLEACQVKRAFARKVHRQDGANTALVFDGYDTVDLRAVRKVVVVAAGKAACSMLEGICEALPVECEISGVIIAPSRPAVIPAGFQYFSGGHPFPNSASFGGAKAALSVVQAASCESDGGTLCVFLISGGASSMMELPLDPTLSIEDTIAFHRSLVLCGAPISEINCVRKHFSAVKGGRLALAAGRTPSISILVSDVPAGQLDSLGSGPTLADSSTLEQCGLIIRRYKLSAQWPEKVRAFFDSPTLPETPKPGQVATTGFTLLRSEDLAESAVAEAVRLGFYAVVDNTCDDWEYRAAAEYLVDRARSMRERYARGCLISVGELTVRISAEDTAGRGGRNQHFALYAATLLKDSDGSLTIFSAGSDGVDGNSRAAGAVVDRGTVYSSEATFAEAQDALRRFDSSTFLERSGVTVITGRTGNNLRDLRMILWN